MTEEFNAEETIEEEIDSTENDNSADSQSEETIESDSDSSTEDNQEEDDKESDNDKDNFANHPRWKEREEDWKDRFNDQEKRHSDDLARLREEFNIKIDRVKPREDIETEIPSWFGSNDVEEWSKFENYLGTLKGKAKEEAIQELKSEEDKKQKSIEEATNYFKEEVRFIETDKNINPNNIKVDQNKLMKFVLDNELVDTKGRWNYRAAFKIMQAGIKKTNTDSINEKKRIADATTGNKGGEEKDVKFTTNEDFSNPSNRPW